MYIICYIHAIYIDYAYLIYPIGINIFPIGYSLFTVGYSLFLIGLAHHALAASAGFARFAHSPAEDGGDTVAYG